MYSQCLVLKLQSDQELLLGHMRRAINAVNKTLGTYYANAGFEDKGQAQYYFWVDYSVDDAGRIQLTNDSTFPAQYIDVLVTDPTDLDVICETLKSELDIFSCAELKAKARKLDTISSDALACLGLGCVGSYDSEIAEMIKQGFQSEERQIRDCALMAAFLLKWKELLPILENALQKEGDEKIRRGLHYAIKMMQQA